MSKPIVAVVGRPNVGKSTLFNQLAGRMISIVQNTPGVTRDRIYADIEWLNYNFTMIDTGGIEPESDDVILKGMRVQAQIAIDTADVIVFVVDMKAGLTDDDNKVANILRKAKKPVILCVNKVDNYLSQEMGVYEFYNLGLGDPIPVSSAQNSGMGDLLDAIVSHFDQVEKDPEDEEIPKIAIIGKPNVGKSSLVNRLLGENRVLVSDVAGTTRDAIDTRIKYDKKDYIFIDTAGVRRKNKVKEELERYSIVRTVAAIERADIVILMIDAVEGLTEQDAKIAGIAHERGKGAIIAVNKWDAIEKDDKTMKNFENDIAMTLSYMPYAQKIFISALTGQRTHKIFEAIDLVRQHQNMRISTGVMNDLLYESMSLHQPPSDKGKRLKIYYMTQVTTNPPTFVLFVNDKELAHYSYIRFIENKFRESFGFFGTPIKMIIRERKED